MEWYYVMHNEQVGPIGTEAVKSLLMQGTLTTEDYVWNEKLGADWVPIDEITEFSGSKNDPVNNLSSSEGDDYGNEDISTGKYSIDQVAHHINVRMAEGVSKNKILRELSENGVAEKIGFQLIQEVNRNRHSEHRSAGLFHIFIGIGSIIGGLALSLVFSSVLGMLGFGVLFYGLIIAGVLESLNGLRYLIFGALKLSACIPILAIIFISGALVALWFYNIPSVTS